MRIPKFEKAEVLDDEKRIASYQKIFTNNNGLRDEFPFSLFESDPLIFKLLISDAAKLWLPIVLDFQNSDRKQFSSALKNLVDEILSFLKQPEDTKISRLIFSYIATVMTQITSQLKFPSLDPDSKEVLIKQINQTISEVEEYYKYFEEAKNFELSPFFRKESNECTSEKLRQLMD